MVPGSAYRRAAVALMSILALCLVAVSGCNNAGDTHPERTAPVDSPRHSEQPQETPAFTRAVALTVRINNELFAHSRRMTHLAIGENSCDERLARMVSLDSAHAVHNDAGREALEDLFSTMSDADRGRAVSQAIAEFKDGMSLRSELFRQYREKRNAIRKTCGPTGTRIDEMMIRLVKTGFVVQ